jgi:hypothetical protein
MNDFEINEMKPGILVVQNIRISGGIHYEREEEESYFEEQSHIKKWRTTSHIYNVAERNRAQQTKTEMYTLIKNQCIKTPVGFICREDNKDKLNEAFLKAKQKEKDFNSSAETCKIISHCACFEIKEDNYQTISAISDQIAEVAEKVSKSITQDDLTTLKSSARRWLKGMKPDSILLLPDEEKEAVVARVRAELIRKAIVDIKGVENLLPVAAGKRAQELVQKSRSIAKDLCNRVERKHHSLDQVLEEVNLAGIKRNRTSFMMAAIQAQEKSLSQEESIPLFQQRNYSI